LEPLIAKTLGFALVMTRLSAFFVCLPVFSWKTIPGAVKIALGLWMTIFFAGGLTMPFDAEKITPLQAILMMGAEVVYGAAMGLTAAMVFAAVRVGGAIVDQQMGFSMAEILDPMTGEQGDMVGVVVEMLFILLFLAAEGHHLLLLMLQKSYTAFPIGSMPDIGLLTNMVVQAGAVMMMTALKMSAPILALFLIMVVVLGVMARVLPDMNILFESMPLRVGIGLVSLVIFLPLMTDFVKEFAVWMSKLMPV
jgi:flagellar biosynthetic protein FliR